MNTTEARDIGVTVLAGGITAIILFMFMQPAPGVGLASIYLYAHAAVFFGFLGWLVVFAVRSTKAQSRLVSTYVVSTSIVSVVLVSTSQIDVGAIGPFVLLGLVVAGVGGIAFHVDLISTMHLYHGVALLGATLFVFAAIYLGVLMIQSETVRYLIPLAIMGIVYGAVINSIRTEIAAGTP